MPSRLLKAYAIGFLLCCFTTLAGTQSSDSVSPPAKEDLQKIGVEIMQAVLQKKPAPILKYDSPRLSREDAEALKDPHSFLSCNLFDSTCTDGHRTSIHEQFRRAYRLKVKATPYIY